MPAKTHCQGLIPTGGRPRDHDCLQVDVGPSCPCACNLRGHVHVSVVPGNSITPAAALSLALGTHTLLQDKSHHKRTQLWSHGSRQARQLLQWFKRGQLCWGAALPSILMCYVLSMWRVCREGRLTPVTPSSVCRDIYRTPGEPWVRLELEAS